MDAQGQKSDGLPVKIPALIVAVLAAVSPGRVTRGRSPLPTASAQPASPTPMHAAFVLMRGSGKTRSKRHAPRERTRELGKTAADKPPPTCAELIAQPTGAAEGEKSASLLPIIVLVDGARYPENAEQRIRTRAAVLAALGRWGYEPEDAEHLEICKLAADKGLLVAVERFTLHEDDKLKQGRAGAAREGVYGSRAKRVPVVLAQRSRPAADGGGHADRRRIGRGQVSRHVA